MKKIDREFCISDDSVNVYGYRLLTSGFELEKFNPPIGFLMHERDKGVAVRWEDFRTEYGCIYAKPVINDEQFPQLAQQIEEGFYNAASVGHIVALEVSDDNKYKLEGQTGPTVLRWFCRECSIVDIPGNYNAIARLYDESDNLLHDLSENFIKTENMKTPDNSMTGVMVAVAALGLPDLKADATAEDAVKAVKELVQRAQQAEMKYNDLSLHVVKQEVEEILSNAVDARKITNEIKDQLKADYAEKPEELRALIAKLPAQELLTESLKKGNIPEHLQGKTLNDLYLSGELENVKRDFPEYFDSLKRNS